MKEKEARTLQRIDAGVDPALGSYSNISVTTWLSQLPERLVSKTYRVIATL
jgi:hypothetical protein